MSDSSLITFQFEGLPEEGGHLKLGDFLKQLDALKKALTKIDQMYSPEHKASIYYRVVALSHNSPATIVLEAVQKKSAKRKKPADVGLRHRRFFQELKAIREKSEPSEDIDTETLRVFQDLASTEERGVAWTKIHDESASIDLDKKFRDNLNRLIEGEDYSFGSVEGQLEAVNLHGSSPSLVIYPSVGATRIHCRFSPHRRSMVKDALDHYVRIVGKKHFRSKAMFPHMIDVSELEILDQSKVEKLSDLRGILAGSGEINMIEDLRNEW